jgi:hypothetical protein
MPYDLFFRTLKFLYSFSFIWVPLILFALLLNIWLRYRRTENIVKAGSILLEIKLPKEIMKSPLAMEVILTSLSQEAKGDYLKTFWQGKIRPWFSFELVSIEGQVKFFMWTQPKFRQLIESQFYAQYPGVEIYEAEDYTKDVFWDPVNLPFWGTAFKLTKADVYPIKTYVDYGLDQNPKEELKIDPMTSILEFLGSIGKGEQIWIQILFQAHRKETFKDDARFSATKPDWTKSGKKEIEDLLSKLKEGKRGEEVTRRATRGETDVVTALERSLSKIPFDVGIRGAYIAKKGSFDAIGITGLIGSFRQYSSRTLNGFKLSKFTDFDYPWQDFRRSRRNKREKKFLNAYKLRSFFYLPYKHAFGTPFVLNTEEIATIFHLPGQVAATPTLMKTASKKSEAPANLPI